MYPRLIEIPLPFEIAGIGEITIFSFGFMVVLAVLAAAWLTGREMDRLYRAGRVSGVQVPVEEDSNRRRTRTTEASPSVLIGTIATIAMIAGIGGAKAFHILENLDLFARDPIGMILSTGGLTFYGGLIVAAAAIWWYLRKQNVSPRLFADALAPGLMLAYGIGRIGCYLAGDGDWGVCSSLANKPGWIPGWLWSETFPNSFLDGANQYTNDAIVLENCGPAADGVFPTMLYEFAMAAAIFGVLWSLRKHPFKAGWLFSLYLVFSGAERFLIEQIRVNNVLDFIVIESTQAEVIAAFTVLLGVIGLALTWRRGGSEAASGKTAEAEEKASTTA